MKLRRWVAEFFDLPLTMRIGLVVVLFGGALDILFHTAPAFWAPSLTAILGAEGIWAHLVTLVGMVITLIAMLVAVLRHRIRPVQPDK